MNNPAEELIDTNQTEDSVEDGITEVANEAEASQAESDAAAELGEELQTGDDLYYDIDGEEISLEQVRQWKSGHMMQSDYTKGKQEVARERESLGEERQALTEVADMFSALEQRIQEMLLGDLADEEVDSELLDSNPQAYYRRRAQREKMQKQIAGLQDEYGEIVGKAYETAQSRLHEVLGWKDEAKFTSDTQAIREYVSGEKSDISDRDFQRITSPGIMQAILKAKKWDDLQASKARRVQQAREGQAAIRPTGKTTAAPKTLAQRMYPNMK